MEQRNVERILNLDTCETGAIIDLSTSGVALLLSTAREKDRDVTISINNEKLNAKVIYSLPKDEKYRVGLQFLNISSEMHSFLEELIDKFSRGIPVLCVLEDKQSGT